METWVEVFKFDYFNEIEERINDYCRTYSLSPLSVSVTMNCGKIFVVIVVKKSEDKG